MWKKGLLACSVIQFFFTALVTFANCDDDDYLYG